MSVQENEANPAKVENFFVQATLNAGGSAANQNHYRRRDRTLAEQLVAVGMLGDAIVILLAMLAGFWLRFYTPLREIGVQSETNFHQYSGYIALGALSLIYTLVYFQIYDDRKLLRYRKISFEIFKACLIWLAGFLCFSLAFKFQPPISRIFVLLVGANALIGLLGWRAIFHGVLQHSSIVSALRQRILFIGWNEASEFFANTITVDPAHPYEIMGCVRSEHLLFQSRPPKSVEILGEYSDIKTIMERNAIDIAILTDANCANGDVIGLANLCEKEMVQFKVIPSYFQILISGLHLETVSGIPMLGVSRLPLQRFLNATFKRVIDIAGAVVGLIFSVPLIAIFGALVYFESPGPIFYRQRRLGRNGVHFDIIKIRSMGIDAEKGTGVMWTRKDDPRRLRIGALIRKWNIDETPQFWNVLKGQMSLVGPRPERPELIENFKEEIPHYNARHNVKPGMTGLAQVRGLRGDTDLSERIKADLYYLENWSVMLDCQIMAATFFRRDNAY